MKYKYKTLFLFIISLILFTLKFSNIPFDENDTKSATAAAISTSKKMGTITDIEGRRLLYSDKEGNIVSNLSADTLHSLSNVLGPEIRYTTASPFTVRGYSSDTLYGIYQNGFSKKSILATSRIGGDVQLTINTNLQKKTFEILTSHPDFFKKPENMAGSIIIMNYKTGDVLALASSPSFSINNPSSYRISTKTGLIDTDYKNSSIINRCVQTTYMPASLMKVHVIAAALSENYSLKDTAYTCTGRHNILSCGSAHGTLSISSAIAQSCNCFTEFLGESIQDFDSTLKELGFNEQAFSKRKYGYYEGTIDYSTENQEIYTLIGEGSCKISPLSLASTYTAIFNNGIMTAPRIIHAESQWHKDQLINTSESRKKRVYTSEAAEICIDGMKCAVKEGTAQALASLNQEVAAKTGTTEKNTVAWTVAGFLNHEYMVVCCLENTTSSGGQSAAVMTYEIMDYMEKEYL